MREITWPLLFLFAMLSLLLPALVVDSEAEILSPRGDAPQLTEVGSIELKLRPSDDGRRRKIPLEEYLVGVIAAEMPASFAPEALKAQAVVARTYAVRRLPVFGGAGCRSEGADLCSDHGRGQAWIAAEEMRRRWGLLGYYRNRRKIERAVTETAHLILVYDGRPIDAVYHSTSGGRTEEPQYVWQEPLPYLTAVDSPWGDHSPEWLSESRFDLQELAARLDLGSTDLRRRVQGQSPLIRVLERSPGGRVLSVDVGGREFEGTELRRLLDLNSTWFTWSLDRGEVVFSVKGYGHGVGLSQYGADGMARQGADFREILTHYYRGVRLRTIFHE